MPTVTKATRIARARARRAGRLAIRQGRTAGSAAWSRLRTVPVPAPVRQRLHATVPWKPGTRHIRVDRTLYGTQAGIPGKEFARRTGDLLWPSRRVADGPHVGLLRLAAGTSDLTDEQILASDYTAFARLCLKEAGHYFWATDDEGIVEVARDFIGRADGTGSTVRRAHQSPADAPIRVANVRESDCYQVLDGHHRLALAAFRGQHSVSAKVKWVSVTTPLQDTLDEMSWIGGERELYQPVEAPELEQSWATVRRCTDRLDKMLSTVADRTPLDPPSASYLDVASCYGWFVAQMGEAGFAAGGIERDPVARPLGEALYGLRPDQVTTGDAVDLLAKPEQRYDVVSCFSLLHHFALGRARVGAPELARLLDGVTGRVLFLDTGQAHERWFRESLPEWDTAYIANFLREHTSFDEIVDLGADQDAVAPYADNYGRHLFACLRTA